MVETIDECKGIHYNSSCSKRLQIKAVSWSGVRKEGMI